MTAERVVERVNEREQDAITLMKYEEIEEDIFKMRTTGQYSENALSALEPRVNELWQGRTQNSLNSLLLEKDASTVKNLLSSLVKCDEQASSMVLDEFDYEQLEKQLTAKIAVLGLDQFLTTTYKDLASDVAHVSAVTRHFSTPPVKERATAVRAHREQGPAKETVAFDAEQQQNQEVQAILKVKLALKDLYLETRKPIPIYQFAFNKHSFSQTIENLFYTSFLVRDNAVAISYKQDVPLLRPLFIRPCDYEPAENQTEKDPYVIEDGMLEAHLEEADFRQHDSESRDRSQFVSEMSFSLWETLKDVYPEEPIIPSRRAKDECPFTG